MKALKLLLLSFFILLAPKLFSQARLTITSLENFPGMQLDTAYAALSYDSILITIKNTGSTFFQGEADVILVAGTGVPDTLFLDSIGGTNLAPGDSVIRRPPPYQFNSVHFDDGDNIVVVWPQARTSGTLADSLLFLVHFVSLQSITEAAKNVLQIFPNPGTDLIHLGILEINQVEYVRIFNSEGRLVYHSSGNPGMIPVRGWTPGLYLLEVLGNKRKYSGRLIIQ